MKRSHKHTLRFSLIEAASPEERDLKVIHTEMIAEFTNEINRITFREI